MRGWRLAARSWGSRADPLRVAARDALGGARVGIPGGLPEPVGLGHTLAGLHLGLGDALIGLGPLTTRSGGLFLGRGPFPLGEGRVLLRFEQMLLRLPLLANAGARAHARHQQSKKDQEYYDNHD